MYFQDIALLSGVSNPVVLAEIIAYMDYENYFILNPRRTKTITTKANCSTTTLHRVLNEMVKSDIAIRDGKGQYLINGRIFGRGKWIDIKKAIQYYQELKIQITYNKQGRLLETIITGDDA